MYRPPFDHENSDNEREDGEIQHAVPPRRSALSRKHVTRQHRDFYSDEHPEIPKVRRASLKQAEVDVLMDAHLEKHNVYGGGKTSVRACFSGKLIRDPRLPFRNPEAEQRREDDEIPPYLYPRQARKKAQQTMLPLTGLEDFDEISEWQHEAGYQARSSSGQDDDLQGPLSDPAPVEYDETAVREKSSWQNLVARRLAQQTEGLRLLKIPRRRPGSGSNPTTDYTGSSLRLPFWGHRRIWVLVGLLAMLTLIIVPLIFHVTSSPSNVSVGQNPIVPSLPGNPHELVITPPNTDHPAPPLFATSAYLLDEDHETTMYAQNPFLHLPMLSTTKLMTAVLTAEKGNLDQSVTISPLMQQQINGLSADSALFGLKEGQTYTLRDLLYGLLYVSGNDAALVIADTVGGSVQNFVTEMNQKARSLGMLDTHYVNPHGLLDDGQYSCAHDLAILGQYSLNIPLLQQISSNRTYQIAAGGNHAARMLLNENQFLWWYPGATGGKTGYDGVNDFVQVVSVTRNNHHLIGVVMHTNNWWTDMRDLMDYGLTDYAWVSPRDVDSSGHPVVFDSLWNYFATDTPQYTVPMGTGGRYYVYTGYSVSGPILGYFDQQGGLKKFGFPIKMPVPSSDTKITQQFQHGSIQCDVASKQCRVI